MMSFRTILMAAIASVGVISAANAVPVNGQISLGGYAQAVGSTGMGMATGINFANASGTSVTGTSDLLGSYGGGSGAFAALGACASATTGCGTIKDIASFTSAGTVSQFLTLATGTNTSVSFDLTSIGSVTRAMDSTGGSLVFTANGIINYTGYDSTAGVFTLTTQGNSINSFSATTLAAAAVPEPMSLGLLGAGLAGIGLIRRRKESA